MAAQVNVQEKLGKNGRQLTVGFCVELSVATAKCCRYQRRQRRVFGEKQQQQRKTTTTSTVKTTATTSFSPPPLKSAHLVFEKTGDTALG